MTAWPVEEHVEGWLPDLRDPLQGPDPAPPEPSGWHRPGGDPAQPDKALPSVFELHAASCQPPKERPAKKVTPEQRRKRRRR